MLKNCGCRLQHSTDLQKSEKCLVKAHFHCKKQAFLRISAWICAKLWRKLQMSTSVFNLYCRTSKNAEWKHSLQCKNVRFWEFLPEFVQFCEKTWMELQILTSIINIWVSQKHAFFIVYAWICAFLWEICKESCRCWLQYLIEVFEKKQKILTWSTICSTKTREFFL